MGCNIYIYLHGWGCDEKEITLVEEVFENSQKGEERRGWMWVVIVGRRGGGRVHGGWSMLMDHVSMVWLLFYIGIW